MSSDFTTKLMRLFGVDSEPVEETDEVEDLGEAPKARNARLVAMPSPAQAEVLVLEPRTFDDSMALVTHLREKRAIILNLHLLPAEQVQRLVDFVAGATYAIDGNQERISDRIFAFSPSNVKINAQRQNEQPWGILPGGGHRDLAYKVN